MLFIQSTGSTWDLGVLFDEFWFRAITILLVVGFIGLVIYLRRQNIRRKTGRSGLTGNVAELLLVVFVWIIESCRTSFHERSRRSQQQCLVSCL
jgi:hypothetical protein